MTNIFKPILVGLVQAVVSMLLSYFIKEAFDRYIFPRLDKLWPKKKKAPIGFGMYSESAKKPSLSSRLRW